MVSRSTRREWHWKSANCAGVVVHQRRVALRATSGLAQVGPLHRGAGWKETSNVGMFVLCRGCSRHFREDEPECPFCSASAAGLRPRPIPKLPSNASRAHRYGASAALLAGSAAVFSCGGSSASGSNTDGGSTNTVSSGAVNTGSTATVTSGSNSTTGGGGSSASGGTTTSTSGAVNTGRACPGYQETGNCRSVADCAGWFDESFSPVYCSMTPIGNQGCGNPTFLPMCPVDGCPDGMVCVRLDPCGGEICQDACSAENCDAPNHCVDGVCEPLRCDTGGAAPCNEGYRCDPDNATSPNGCVPIPCTENPDACDPWRTCDGNSADAFGCTVTPCTVDEDCGDCGYCVSGRCEPTLGTCYQEQPAMPYGCVWPDEELV